MNAAQWMAQVAGAGDRLAALDSESPSGQRQAVLALWQLFRLAPSSVQKLYETLDEAAILAQAFEVEDALDGLGFGFPASKSADPVAAVLAIGGHLRALETRLADLDAGSIPAFPGEDYRVANGEGAAYLVPLSRTLWRVERSPGSDRRPFDQRALLRHRLIPTEVDGAAVTLVRAGRLGSVGEGLLLGAVLFPGLEFDCAEDARSFLVIAVRCKATGAVIAEAAEGSHSPGCLAAVFPELTVDDAGLAAIVDQLVRKPWQDAKGASLGPQRTPAVIVAGSWHRAAAGGHVNAAPVLDGDGNEFLRHVKRKPFTDPEGRIERIKPGEEIAVLVFDEGLVAFGICLDFCDRTYRFGFDELDVDLVLVPSCGNASTMSSHLANARQLLIRRRSRTLVVQQAYPMVQGAVGYVLSTRSVPEAVADVVENRSWSVTSA